MNQNGKKVEHDFFMSDSDLFELYSAVGLEKTILLFKGLLTQDILVVLAEMLTNNLSTNPKHLNTKKMFFVFVELAQNVHRYSAEKVDVDGREVGCGIVLVNEHNGFYRIISGNLIDNIHIPKLQGLCEQINALDEDGLKNLRKEKLKKPKEELQRGAGVGLIDIQRKAGHPIEMKTKRIDDHHSFLTFFIKMDKGQ